MEKCRRIIRSGLGEVAAVAGLQREFVPRLAIRDERRVPLENYAVAGRRSAAKMQPVEGERYDVSITDDRGFVGVHVIGQRVRVGRK